MLDNAWQSWNFPVDWYERAKDYCREVKIAFSGGFGPPKIKWFEELNVPVHIYGVGSSLMSNDNTVGPNTDFTTDVVRVKVNGQCMDMAKVGRAVGDNLDLEPVDLAGL